MKRFENSPSGTTLIRWAVSKVGDSPFYQLICNKTITHYIAAVISAIIFLASSFAVASDPLSEYILIIGSVLEVRRCTQLLSKSIRSPSSVFMGWAAYLAFICSNTCFTSTSSPNSILFFEMKSLGWVARSYFTVLLVWAKWVSNNDIPKRASLP